MSSSKLTTISEAIPSDAFQFGGEPLNQIIMILTGSNLDSEENIKIDTTFRFYSGKFAIYEDDPARLSKVVFKVENIDTLGDKSITIRNPTVADDFMGTEKQIQVFENKAWGANTTFAVNVDANNNSLTELKSLTLVNHTATDPTATATETPFYRKDLDANNQAIYISKRENGQVIKVRVT
jgi:hypothetical protein